VTPKSGRKRSISQSKLDNFTPNGTASESLLCAGGTLSVAPVTKKRRSASLSAKRKSSASAKRGRKPGSTPKKTPKGSSAKKSKKVKKERKTSKSFSSPTTPKSPLATSNSLYGSAVTPTVQPLTKSPRSKASALKVLNKAKKFKQMDLKKNVMRKKDLTPEELAALKEIKERERKKKADEEKRKREEERLRKEEERRRREEEKKERKEEVKKEREEERRRLREERMNKKLRELEWLKPREDLTCEDSLVRFTDILCQLLFLTQTFGFHWITDSSSCFAAAVTEGPCCEDHAASGFVWQCCHGGGIPESIWAAIQLERGHKQ